MSSNTPLRLGFIGAGMISQVMHLESFSRDPRVRIAAISDPRPNQCREVAARYGATPLTHEQQLLEDASIDAVVICVYRRCQAPLARAAIAAGKHVFSEKPIAYSVGEAQALVQQVEASRKHYAVSYMKRFDAGVRAFRETLQQVMQSGEMGELFYVHMRDFCPTYGATIPPHVRRGEKPDYRYELSAFPPQLPKEHQADFDYSLNVISHDLNLLHFLFGPIFTPERFSVKEGCMQQAVLASPQFEVTLAAGTSDHGKWDQTVEIGFRHGRILLHLTSPMDRQHPAHYEIERPSGHQHLRVDTNHPWAFQAQATHFIDRCQGANLGDISLDTSGKNGLSDLLLIEKLWENVTWKR